MELHRDNSRLYAILARLEKRKMMFVSMTTEKGLKSDDYRCPNCKKFDENVSHKIDGVEYPIIMDEYKEPRQDLIPTTYWTEVQRCSKCKTKYHYQNHA
jgi:hypothetical protein